MCYYSNHSNLFGFYFGFFAEAVVDSDSILIKRIFAYVRNIYSGSQREYNNKVNSNNNNENRQLKL